MFKGNFLNKNSNFLNSPNNTLIFSSIISEIVENALKEEQDTCEMESVKSVFMAILQAPGLDIRDRKAGIIDFIAAGIKTVNVMR